MKDYKKIVFKNKLRLIVAPMKNANSVTVLVLVGTGSKYETKNINGISHFLEHMFFKGTKKRPTTLSISETLDGIGGQYNAFTSKEITGFWAKVDKKHTELALDWISDMFLNSKFDEIEIEREKGVVIEEQNMYVDTPTSYISELFEKLLYRDTPAGWRIGGEKENILAYNRQKLIDYYRSHYSNENTVICVAGDVMPKEIGKKVEKYFATVEIRKASAKIANKENQQNPEVLIYNKKTDQTHFCLGARTYSIFDYRRYAVNLLAIILGGNMSSRLFISVRERNGLAYYIHTSIDETTDTGYLTTQAGVKNDSLERAVELVIEEYKDLRIRKIKEAELKKAKDYLRGTLSLSLDASDARASFYASQEVMGLPILTPEEKFKIIDRVSVMDIKKTAEDIFQPEKINLAIIGPVEKEKKENWEKLIKI